MAAPKKSTAKRSTSRRRKTDDDAPQRSAKEKAQDLAKDYLNAYRGAMEVLNVEAFEAGFPAYASRAAHTIAVTVIRPDH